MEAINNKVVLRSLVVTVSLVMAQFLTTGCSQSNFQSLGRAGSASGGSIVNGQEVNSADVQASGFANPVVAIFALLNPQTGEGALCSGTLIQSRVVLTAGHCVENATASTKIMVSFQILDWRTGRSAVNTMQVTKFVIHPNYAAAAAAKTIDQVDDLALLLLPAPAPAGVKPAQLDQGTSPNLIGQSAVTTIGYGQSDDRNNTTDDGAGVLRFTQFSPSEVMVYQGSGPLSGMIVADAEQTSVCHGDSGGPLFSGPPNDPQRVLIGVNDLVLPIYVGQQLVDYKAAEQSGDMQSFFTKYPDAHICLGYNAFVRVSSHLTWIAQTQLQMVGGIEM